MESMQSISAAIEAIPLKKEKLRRTFEDLRSHSACIAAFDLQWNDLEEHLGAIENSIENRFKFLGLAEKNFKDHEVSDQQPAAAAAAATSSQPPPLPSSSHLKYLCSKMDSGRLLQFIIAHRRSDDGLDIKGEFDAALRSSPKPAKLVLDSMEGFYPTSKMFKKSLRALRRACVFLLERLSGMMPLIEVGARERAREIAFQWKEKAFQGGNGKLLEGMAFFQLLETFGLVSEFEVDELLDMLCVIVQWKQTIELCRVLGFADKVPDLIKKLIKKGKQLDAVKFVYAFELVDKFPPVPLLNAYLKKAKRIAERKRGNNSPRSLRESICIEIHCLKDISKFIKDHNLQSEFTSENLEERVAELEKEKADGKRYQHAAKLEKEKPDGKRWQRVAKLEKDKANRKRYLQLNQPSANKRQKAASSSPDSGPPSMSQLPHPAGLLADHVNHYSGSAGLYHLAGDSCSGSGPATLYGLAGGTGVAPVSSAPYPCPGSPGLYGSAGVPGALHDPFYERYLGPGLHGAHLPYGGIRSPPRSHLHAEVSSRLYDKPMGYRAYSVGLPPPFRPSFYP